MLFNCVIPNSKIAWIQATEMINLWKQHEVLQSCVVNMAEKY